MAVTYKRRHRHPWSVVKMAIKLRDKDHLTYRQIESKLEEVGVFVTHKTIYEWSQKFQGEYKKRINDVESLIKRKEI